ncbi:MAG: methionine synthase, partial [Bacteroidales bacterium]|nr:methionine synthase [Bacteroidales bacterium]
SFTASSSASGDEIAIEGMRFGTGSIIRNMLRGAEEYAFFIATAGPGPEELSASLINDGQYLEGYIVDLIGSALVELVADQIQDHIKEMADSRGMNITNRYSPGHCSWDVNEQKKLFDQFPKGFCGIALSDTSLMSPIKSVSGVIGLGSSVSFREYTCEICSMKDCIFRQPKIESLCC